jgi:hypothetical protein
MDQLVLKRASASRPSGHWYDDDYDVLCEGEVVGRIMKAAAAPVGQHGYGRSLTATTRTAPRLTATKRRARLRWMRSPRAGGGNRSFSALGEAERDKPQGGPR